MPWISSWWRSFLKKGVRFTYTGDWPGEKDLPPKKLYPDTVTKEAVEQEIRAAMHKKEEKK